MPYANRANMNRININNFNNNPMPMERGYFNH